MDLANSIFHAATFRDDSQGFQQTPGRWVVHCGVLENHLIAILAGVGVQLFRVRDSQTPLARVEPARRGARVRIPSSPRHGLAGTHRR